MRCPNCQRGKLRVIDSREDANGVRRRRACRSCKARFWTHEELVGESIAVRAITVPGGFRVYLPEQG